MRILNVMLSKDAGGLEAVAFQYARVLAGAGCESAMVVNVRSPYEAADGVTVFRTHGASLANPLNHLAVARAVRRFRPDVVLGHGSRGADFCKSPLVRACAARGTRFVGVLHGENAKHFRGLDRIIAVSEKLREETIAKYGFPPGHIVAVQNAVAVPDMTEDARRETRGETPVIGFLGRFDPCKGLDVLLESCAVLKHRGVDFRLDVGGDGAQKDAMCELAERLGIADFVRWLGWVSDKRTFFACIDVFTMPSREEAVGLSMLEAMARRRAVVISDCPGPKAIVGDCGLVVPREDAVALADALERLLADRAERERLAVAGRRAAEARYSEKRLRDDLLSAVASSGKTEQSIGM